MAREDVLRELDSFDSMRRRPPGVNGSMERGMREVGKRELPRREELAGTVRDEPEQPSPENGLPRGEFGEIITEDQKRALERLPPRPSKEPFREPIDTRAFFEELKTAPELPPELREQARRTIDELTAQVGAVHAGLVSTAREIQRMDRIIILLEGLCELKERLEAVRVSTFELESSPKDQNDVFSREFQNTFFALQRACTDLQEIKARRRDFLESLENSALESIASLNRILDLRLGKVEALRLPPREEP